MCGGRTSRDGSLDLSLCKLNWLISGPDAAGEGATLAHAAEASAVGSESIGQQATVSTHCGPCGRAALRPGRCEPDVLRGQWVSDLVLYNIQRRVLGSAYSQTITWQRWAIYPQKPMCMHIEQALARRAGHGNSCSTV